MSDPSQSQGSETPQASRTQRRWARRLAEVAFELPDGEQDRFLDQVGDRRLRHELASLVDADAEVDTGLDLPLLGRAPEPLPDPVTLLDDGTLGPYELEGLLGSGGMGVVFQARQGDEPPVALKVARPGSALRQRLATEAAVLRQLNHPAIRSLRGEETLAGRSCLALELVEGLPIDQFCAGRSWRQVLEVFVEVCEGVEHAHQRQVLHRDLKPSNILVTEAGQPKLLDFGVAKTLDPCGVTPETSTVTRWSGTPTTPSYASPERLRGEAATVADDVYSLGVVLYQLLTGRLPRELMSLRPKDVEQTFAAPVTPPSQAADLRSMPEAPNRKLLQGVDAILRAALSTEPETRYPTVAALLGDLRRALAGRTVRARRWRPMAKLSHRVRRQGRCRLLLRVAAGLFALLVLFDARVTFLMEAGPGLFEEEGFTLDQGPVTEPPNDEATSGDSPRQELTLGWNGRVDPALLEAVGLQVPAAHSDVPRTTRSSEEQSPTHGSF